MKEQEAGPNPLAKREGHVPFSQLAAFGSGGIIPIALFNIAGILVGLMGNISLGLSAFWLGVILIIPRLWDALSDPVIGHLSDNTRTRWGRRRPYLLLGGILVGVCFVVMWWIPKGELVHAWFPLESGFQAFQLCYILFALLLFFTACNIFEIPHGALGMEMTTDYHERTRLFSAKSFVGNLFAMSTPWLFVLANMEIFKGAGGNEADGMRYVSLLIAAIVIPLAFWWFFSLREPGFERAARQERTPFWADMKRTTSNKNFIMLTLTVFTLAMGFNFVNLLGSYIPIFYVFGGDKVAGARLLGINGTVWAVTGLLAVFPLNWISPRVGKRNTLIIAISLMCLAQISKIVCYNPAHPYLIVIPTLLLSTGMLFFFTLGASSVGDICDEDEVETRHRSEGSYYSIFWWFIKLGTAFASFVAGVLIVFTAFDETQVTKVDGLQGNVRELRSEVKYWQTNQGLGGGNGQWIAKIRTESSKALAESKEYLRVVKKKYDQMPQKMPQQLSADSAQRNTSLLNALSTTKSTVGELEQLQLVVDSSGPQTRGLEMDAMVKRAIPLTLQTKLEKARMSSFDLLSHLAAKSLRSADSKVHYEELISSIAGVDSRLRDLSTTSSLELLDRELGTVENEIMPLTKQTPHTLLMMRVVEIGLPILLCIFSLFFVLRYSLTEQRCHAIRELLKQRNMERSKEEATTNQPLPV